MTEKTIHQCPVCKSNNLKWSQFWNSSGYREKMECTCLDCGYNGNWEEFYLEIPVVPDKLHWVSEGLLYDIKDYLERVNNLDYYSLKCDDLIEKINEVLNK